MVSEDCGDIVVGCPGMDHGRLGKFSRQLQLSFEGTMLQRARRMIVVDVEAGLPYGNDPGIPERIPEPALCVQVPAGGVVRVNPCGGDQPWLDRGQREGALRTDPGLSNHDNPAHPRRPGTREDIGQVVPIRRVRQMTVGVD